jgi:mono/diheme cytochrome c family protein
MVQSVPYDTFAANPNFPDGKTLQLPEPGTIPRGHLPLHFKATPEDALRAGEELRNPYRADDPKVLQRGKYIYANYCQLCHGATGKGDGPLTVRGVPPPPSFLAEKAVKMRDGQIFHVLTYGQGNMAAYASQIPREDRWYVTAFVRGLQKQGGGK